MTFTKRITVLHCALVIAIRLLPCLDSEYHNEETTLLVIGVLSAQNNSAARLSIRQTWKTLIHQENKNIKFFFVIGKNICPIHPVDRKSELSCEALGLLSDSGVNQATWTPQYSINNNYPPKSFVTSFTLRTNFPILIRSVRVWRGAVSLLSSFTVTLKNAVSGTEIVSVPHNQFSSLSGEGNEWMEAQQRQFLLPKSFDLEVQFLSSSMENKLDFKDYSADCYGRSLWFNFSEAIEFNTQFGPDTGWKKFDEDSCSPVSLLLELHDLSIYVQERGIRSNQWFRESTCLAESLKSEQATERDIIFVDVVDVYRNIPNKMLKFYGWANQHVNFDFLLKADDDTFVDVPLILKHLEFLASTKEKFYPHMWWWGNLRHGLPVERHGKWQELEYAAPIYPPFPCGGGYIINKEIVDFLVSNSIWLHSFQGEDTSLGIWLAAVCPDDAVNAPCYWTCGHECSKNSCNRGQLSPDNMLSVWRQYQRSQKLC